MAITWDMTISVINNQRTEVAVVAIRTDDDPEKGSVRTYQAVAPASTVDEEEKLWDGIWKQYQDEIARETASKPVVSDLEANGKDNLEAREIG